MGGVRLKAHQVYPLPEDKKGEELMAAIAECVTDFLAKNRVSPEGFYFGLPGERVVCRRLEFPLAVKENLRETLRYEMEKYIPLPIEDVVYDYQVISEDKESKQLELLLTVARKADVDGYWQLARTLRIGLCGIGTRAAALVNHLVAADRIAPDEDGAVALVESGGVSVGLVTRRHLVYAASHRSGDDGGDAAGVLLSALRPLRRLRPDAAGPLAVWLCAAGDGQEGGIALPPDADFDIRPLSPEAGGLPSWDLAAAYGLALDGLQKTPVQVNLLPAGLRKKPSRGGYFLMLALSAAVVSAALAWGAGHVVHQRQLNRLLDAEIETLAAEIETVDQIQAEAKRLEARIATVNALRLGGVPALQVLTEITAQLPDTAWVRDLTLNTEELRLDGYADSASELLPLLDESPLLKDMAFLSAITKDRDGKERFRVGGKLQPAGGGQ